MFLRANRRIKDGKEHRYWNIVENRRTASGKTVQQQVLYLGEINDRQRLAWQKTIELFEEGCERPRQVALFPEDREDIISDEEAVRIRLKDMQLHNPRQWGACWLATHLYDSLGLNEFWENRLSASRKKTRWDLILKLLVCYRLIEPGSEWRLHRHWFDNTAMGDLCVRPIHHQKEHRVEAHIFIAFVAYCLHATLRLRLAQTAPGLTPRSLLESFATMSMLDVHLPTTDGRTVILTRYTQPSKKVRIILDQLKLTLPDQPPPKIASPDESSKELRGGDL